MYTSIITTPVSLKDQDIIIDAVFECRMVVDMYATKKILVYGNTHIFRAKYEKNKCRVKYWKLDETNVSV